MKVLITGAAGQLGQAMAARLRDGHDVTAWTRAEVDLTRHVEVRDAILSLAPELVINCASYRSEEHTSELQSH